MARTETIEVILIDLCHPGCYPDGYCVAPPDIHDPRWKGNTKPMQAIFVAPPNARLVK